MLFDLEFFKNSLEKASDSQMFSLVCWVIEPIIKEYRHLQKKQKAKENERQRIELIKRYTNWIERARPWTEFGFSYLDLKAIEQAVILYFIQDLKKRIERDIQVIKVYLNQKIKKLKIPNSHKGNFNNKLNRLLSPILLKLNALKSVEKGLTLTTITLKTEFQSDKVSRDFESELFLKVENHSQTVEASPINDDFESENFVNLSSSTTASRIIQWRSITDQQRSNLFGSALQAIDKIFSL